MQATKETQFDKVARVMGWKIARMLIGAFGGCRIRVPKKVLNAKIEYIVNYEKYRDLPVPLVAEILEVSKHYVYFLKREAVKSIQEAKLERFSN